MFRRRKDKEGKEGEEKSRKDKELRREKEHRKTIFKKNYVNTRVVDWFNKFTQRKQTFKLFTLILSRWFKHLKLKTIISNKVSNVVFLKY